MRCSSEYYDEIAQFNLAPVLLSLRAIYLFRIGINKIGIEYNYANICNMWISRKTHLPQTAHAIIGNRIIFRLQPSG